MSEPFRSRQAGFPTMKVTTTGAKLHDYAFYVNEKSMIQVLPGCQDISSQAASPLEKRFFGLFAAVLILAGQEGESPIIDFHSKTVRKGTQVFSSKTDLQSAKHKGLPIPDEAYKTAKQFLKEKEAGKLEAGEAIVWLHVDALKSAVSVPGDLKQATRDIVGIAADQHELRENYKAPHHQGMRSFMDACIVGLGEAAADVNSARKEAAENLATLLASVVTDSGSTDDIKSNLCTFVKILDDTLDALAEQVNEAAIANPAKKKTRVKTAAQAAAVHQRMQALGGVAAPAGAANAPPAAAVMAGAAAVFDGAAVNNAAPAGDAAIVKTAERAAATAAVQDILNAIVNAATAATVDGPNATEAANDDANSSSSNKRAAESDGNDRPSKLPRPSDSSDEAVADDATAAVNEEVNADRNEGI